MTILTLDQYWFLTSSPCLSPKVYNDVGMECYADGYIDDFGIVTPKGRQALEEYLGQTKPSFAGQTKLPYGMAEN